MKYTIFLSPPHMGGDELTFIHEAFATNWLAPVGPQVDAFEQEFCAYTGAVHAAALSSGTAALHLALVTLGIGPGDDVICSTFTFAGSANPIMYVGATPVFVDSEKDSWGMDPDLLETAIKKRIALGKKVKALILVHLYGQSANLDPIVALCDKYGVVLIEDAAESLGSYYGTRHTGTIGRIGIFSFNGNKIITTGGGGMFISTDAALVNKARFLATQARDPAPHYEHSHIGYNYRLSSVASAMGRGQLKILEDRVSRRHQIFDYYYSRLAKIPGIAFMPRPDWGRSNRWLTCITVDPTATAGISRETLRLSLENKTIESRPLWKPMHLQPVFKNAPTFSNGVSETLFNYGLCLPSGSAMSNDDLDIICDCILSVVNL